MDKKEKKSLPEPRTYTVEQIAAMLNIGRTTAYQLVKQEEFRIVRIGNAIRIRTVSGRYGNGRPLRQPAGDHQPHRESGLL